MTFAHLRQCTIPTIACLGIAILLFGVLQADEALLAKGMSALLPTALCALLLIRIARKSGTPA